MTGSELLFLGLVVAAAVVAGYFIGRWSADRDLGERSARPNPLPAPGDDFSGDDMDGQPGEAPAQRAPSRPRGAPPPASAGGDRADAPPAPTRTRSASPPPASAGAGNDASVSGGSAPSRPRRGPPPPAAAGVMGTGDTTKNDR